MIPILILVVALLAWGTHLAWRWKQTRDFAPSVLSARQADGDIPGDVTDTEFTDLYLRSEGPRAATYFYICAVITALMIAPVTTAANAIWVSIWKLTGENPVFETGTLIHTFSMFLMIMGFMIVLLAVAMRRYYALMPPTLKHVMRDLGGGQS